MTLPPGILIGWLGDDFTGAAACMEVLEFAGVPSALFLDVPTPEQLARFPGIRAVGIATTARSHSPDWMAAHLPRLFRGLTQSGARVVHYKTCSTLDSAPHVGSIGKAIDIGRGIVSPGGPVPFLVAAPVMRRYQAFGQLFAAAGERVYRLDRHPVMAQHPVTPMTEADVPRHLIAQTDTPVGLVTVEDLETAPAAAFARETAKGAGIIALDAMDARHMAANGALIWDQPAPMLVAGSQGVEYALIGHWRAAGLLPRTDQTAGIGPADRIVAVSGSVSPITAAQIDRAGQSGFQVIALDAAHVALGLDGGDAALTDARAALAAGRDPLICTARGPDDPAVTAMRGAIAKAGLDAETANARIGTVLGRVLRQLLAETGIRRAVISGGDTSGHACRALGLYAFTALAPTVPGAALLRAHSDDDTIGDIELALKGGQMGNADYFGWIKRGGGTAGESEG